MRGEGGPACRQAGLVWVQIPAARLRMVKSKGMEFLMMALAILILVIAFFVFKKEKIEVYLPAQNLKIEAEKADNFLKWSKGLMFREFLPENSGMLFVFSDEKPRTFWMKNTKIPLDLLFISGDKKIVEIKENFEPCPGEKCPIYNSKLSAKYVLEVNAGLAEKYNIKTARKSSFVKNTTEKV